MNLFFKEMDSPIGKLGIVVSDSALVAILMETEKPGRIKLDSMRENKNHPLIQQTEKQLQEYFKCKRTIFDIPVAPQGTVFQKEVWKALQEIPYGTTLSYAQIAKKIKRPKAVRAVGTAIGKNPASIVIPCHRVIGANGHLTGFAGGLETKAALLKLESK